MHELRAPLIYAFEQTDVAVTGPGTLDGSAGLGQLVGLGRARARAARRLLSDAKALNALADANVPVERRVFGAGHYLRPNFIEPYRCTNVLIEGVTVLRSPMWEINPVLCRNVIVRDVKISSLGPNNDGCDPESCRDVLIEGCVFNAGDDCIAIKSGRNTDGRRINVPSENLIIRRCSMQDGHAGVAIGSEVSGNCRNVFVEDCRMSSPHLDRALAAQVECQPRRRDREHLPAPDRHRPGLRGRPDGRLPLRGGVPWLLPADRPQRLDRPDHGARLAPACSSSRASRGGRRSTGIRLSHSTIAGV